jgi:hypothetical protein
LVEALPRISGRAPRINSRGNVAVRLEAIDALETHFSGTHQELAGANAARDRLLGGLGFTNVRFWADLPNRVESVDRDSVRGHGLSNGIDADGRVIGFVYPGDPIEPDGSELFVDEARAGASLNARLLALGDAYPAFYATLPASLRTALAEVSRAARGRRPAAGLWPRSTADPDGPATIADLDTLETLVLWPKLFRRIVPYLAAGFADFDGFDGWLRADPVDRDDELFCSTGSSAGTCTTSSAPPAGRSRSRSGRRTSSSAPTRRSALPRRHRDRSWPPPTCSSSPRCRTRRAPTRAERR